MKNVTLAELAVLEQVAGRLRAFDTALPQEFVDDIYDVTGVWPRGFVWSFDASAFGQPYPLTAEAAAHLDIYNAVQKERTA